MRVKHSPASRRKVKKLLGRAKGFWGERSKKVRRAHETLRRAGVYSYRDRRRRKTEFRELWILRINAAAAERGMSYSEFIGALKKNNILLSRDMLAKIAAEQPQAFDKILATVKK